MKKRVYGLDFLRLIASICIVFHHYQQLTGAFFEGGLNFYGGKFSFGYCVELFFVLSGFLQFGEINRIKNGEINFKEYYKKKLIRLMPMLVISTLVMTGLIIMEHSISGEYWMSTRPDLWALIINLLGLSAGWGFNVQTINSPLWYISSLLLCYVVLYVEVLVSRKLKTNEEYGLIIITVLSVVFCIYDIKFIIINAYSCRAFYSFFTGVLLKMMIEKYDRNKMLMISAPVGIAVVIWLIIFHFSLISNWISYIMACFFYPLLIVIFSSDAISHIFRKEAWMVIGKITFDVYVWHIPVLITIKIIEEYIDFNVSDKMVGMLIYALICFAVGTMSFFNADVRIEKLLMDICYEKDHKTETYRNN